MDARIIDRENRCPQIRPLPKLRRRRSPSFPARQKDRQPRPNMASRSFLRLGRRTEIVGQPRRFRRHAVSGSASRRTASALTSGAPDRRTPKVARAAVTPLAIAVAPVTRREPTTPTYDALKAASYMVKATLKPEIPFMAYNRTRRPT